jgi:hypothetical protein
MFAWRSTRSESQRYLGGRKLEEARATRGRSRQGCVVAACRTAGAYCSTRRGKKVRSGQVR